MIIVPTNSSSKTPAAFKSAGYFITTGPSALSVSVGDIIVVFACANQNYTISPASGFTQVANVDGYSLGWRVATSTTVNIGTWGNSGHSAYGVFSGSGVGGYAASRQVGEANDGAVQIYAPAITMQSSGSQVMQFGYGANFAGEYALLPNGYDTGNLTVRADSYSISSQIRAYTQNTPTGATRWTGNKNNGSTLIRWRTATIEIVP